MKIVTWNCNGALRKKIHALDNLNADIYVIQECEDPSTFSNQLKSWTEQYLWHGKNKNKGIGIFAKNGHSLKVLHWKSQFQFQINGVKHRPLTWNTDDLELFLPCTINDKIPLLAVWTKANNSKNFAYMGQFWLYLQMHRMDLQHKNQIICGDFNSNSQWDEPDRLWNHSDVIEQLKDIYIQSLYHYKLNEQQGKELTPTFFLQQKVEKPYHIDYIFLHQNLIKNSDFKVHTESHWLEISDHRPLECVLNVP